jgi:chorismate mutase
MSGAAPPVELDHLRTEIERLDRALLELIAERVRLGLRVAAVKRAAGLPTLDPAQEAAVIRRVTAHARELGLPPEDARDVFWALIGLTRRAEHEP